jgi:hypothetical protein
MLSKTGKVLISKHHLILNMTNLIGKARELMKKQTRKNKSPAWPLTEIAIDKGRELAKRYDVDEELVVVSLYLAHTVFDREIRGKVQKDHPNLSADFVKPHLHHISLRVLCLYL